MVDLAAEGERGGLGGEFGPEVEFEFEFAVLVDPVPHEQHAVPAVVRGVRHCVDSQVRAVDLQELAGQARTIRSPWPHAAASRPSNSGLC
jgi:hypothetical protein